jgi:tripartite-type tricarboxylate transporter receptor subunit TctC
MRKSISAASFFTAASFTAALTLGAGGALAQAWPQKPVRVVIGFAPGGTPDIAIRIFTPRMSEGLGQPVIVENRPGAGGILSMEYTAKAPPDGYTLAFGASGTLLLAKSLYPNTAYDALTSFTPVGLFAKLSYMLVTPLSLPARTLKEFVDLAKAQPGKLNYGSSSPGSLPHVLGEMFKIQSGTHIVAINYKGSAESVNAFLGGDVQMLVDGYPSLGPLVTTGKARALLVTGTARSSKLPDVPTAAEAGLPEFTVQSWMGLVAPAGTPAAVVQRINAELNKAVASKEVIDGLERLTFEPFTTTPEQFAAIIRSDWPKWDGVVKKAGIKIQ